MGWTMEHVVVALNDFIHGKFEGESFEDPTEALQRLVDALKTNTALSKDLVDTIAALEDKRNIQARTTQQAVAAEGDQLTPDEEFEFLQELAGTVTDVVHPLYPPRDPREIAADEEFAFQQWLGGRLEFVDGPAPPIITRH